MLDAKPLFLRRIDREDERYSVIYDGESVGLISIPTGTPRHIDPWAWIINPNVPGLFPSGRAKSLSAAMDAFKVAWEGGRMLISAASFERGRLLTSYARDRFSNP